MASFSSNHSLDLFLPRSLSPYRTTLKTALTFNIKTKHEGLRYKCDQCIKKFMSLAVLNIYKKTHSETNQLMCDICNRSFCNMNVLKKHKLRFGGKEAFTCQYCPVVFHQDELLQTHILRRQSGLPELSCDLWDLKTDGHRQQFLKDHVKVRHEGFRFNCDLCEREFTQSSNLNYHKIAHSGKVAFKCSKCPRSFYETARLKKHMIGRHNERSEMTCDKCDYKTFG